MMSGATPPAQISLKRLALTRFDGFFLEFNPQIRVNSYAPLPSLTFVRSSCIGSCGMVQIKDHRVDNALKQAVARYAPFVFPAVKADSVEAAVAEIREWCHDEQVGLLVHGEEILGWLNHIDKPPPLLFARGDLNALKGKLFAIVGARRPSAIGLRAALYFAKELSATGLHIVSGLARGIDGAAHQGALEAKAPTIAVLGHGLDRVYPSEHRTLAERMVESGGCLLSEYPPFVPPLPAHFPQRNRLISGLSRGVLIVEAAERSGSLITAHFACEQGRDVFALPGGFSETNYEGNHRLIQEGAKLVLRSSDILDELGVVPAPRETHQSPRLSKLFEVCGKVAPLEDLFSLSRQPLSELLEDLENACANGLVKEIAPQQYVWIDR